MKPFGPPSSHLRSPDYTPRGPKLTNARILRHILAGHYGEDRRLAALVAQRRVKRGPKPLSLALKLLKKKPNA